MPVGAILGAAAPIVGGLIGKAVGGGGPQNAQAAVPKDLQGLRQNQIGLLNYLQGFGPMPGMGGGMGQPMGGQQGMPQGGGGNTMGWGDIGSQRRSATPYGPQPTSQQGMSPSFNMGSMGASQFGGGMMNGMGGGMGQMSQGPANNPMLGRMESYFGPLGTPTSALQQQSLGGISQFLGSNPYGQSNAALSRIAGSGGQDFFGQANNAFKGVQNANYFGAAQGAFNKAGGSFDNVGKQNYFGKAEDSFNRLENYNPFSSAQGMLEGMFQNNPGEGVMNALHPQYERAMAEANQTGGRFGSANAILRSRALDDYSLQMQQAMQRGVDQQLQGAGVYGQMGNSLIGAHQAAGQGLLGVGEGRLNQGLGVANGLLGVGQGQLGVGQGQLSQGLGAAQGLLGVGQGRSTYDLGIRSNQLSAAGQLGQNQNNMFGALSGAYGIGTAQAQQEAQRQQQALQILLGQTGVAQGAAFNQPTMVSPTGAQQGAALGGGIGQILAQYGMGGGGGGGGGAFNNPGAAAPSFGIPYRIDGRG